VPVAPGIACCCGSCFSGLLRGRLVLGCAGRAGEFPRETFASRSSVSRRRASSCWSSFDAEFRPCFLARVSVCRGALPRGWSRALLLHRLLELSYGAAETEHGVEVGGEALHERAVAWVSTRPRCSEGDSGAVLRFMPVMAMPLLALRHGQGDLKVPTERGWQMGAEMVRKRRRRQQGRKGEDGRSDDAGFLTTYMHCNPALMEGGRGEGVRSSGKGGGPYVRCKRCFPYIAASAAGTPIIIWQAFHPRS